MREFLDCVFSTNGYAFITGAILFLFTLLLASRRAIGFFGTFIFLLISLGAAFSVKNQDMIKGYFQNTESTSKSGKSQAKAGTENESVMTKLEKAYEDLKIELAEQKKKVDDYFKEDKSKIPDKGPDEGTQNKK